MSGLFLLEMVRFINCATWWSGSDWICPIMGNSCIFHWETNVCFGDRLGNWCNLRRHHVYLLFHWYAQRVWNQWERKTNISEESTCKHSLYPHSDDVPGLQPEAAVAGLHTHMKCKHTCSCVCMYLMVQPRPEPASPADPISHFLAVRVTKHWHRLPREAPCLEVLKSNLDMVLGNQLQMAVLEQVAWTVWPPEVPSNLTQPVIVWFHVYLSHLMNCLSTDASQHQNYWSVFFCSSEKFLDLKTFILFLFAPVSAIFFVFTAVSTLYMDIIGKQGHFKK